MLRELQSDFDWSMPIDVVVSKFVDEGDSCFSAGDAQKGRREGAVSKQGLTRRCPAKESYSTALHLARDIGDTDGEVAKCTGVSRPLSQLNF